MTTLGILMSNLRLPSSSGPLSSSQGHLYTSLASALVFSMPCAPTVGPLPFSQRPLPFSPTCVFFFVLFLSFTFSPTLFLMKERKRVHARVRQYLGLLQLEQHLWFCARMKWSGSKFWWVSITRN